MGRSQLGIGNWNWDGEFLGRKAFTHLPGQVGHVRVGIEFVAGDERRHCT